MLGGLSASSLYLTKLSTVAFAPALAIKLVFGAIVAVAVTPSALRHALRLPATLQA
jgi:hypothetical protein